MSIATVRQLTRVRGVVFVLLGTMVPLAGAQTSTPATPTQASQTEPNTINTWIDRGQAHLSASQFDDAKNSFLEAIALDYRSGDAHFGLGLAEYGRGDYQAALFAFNEVTRLYPERFDGHFNRAVTLARLRNTEEAISAFGAAIEQAQPEATTEDLINAYQGLAGQLKRLERFADAADAYGKAAELRPEDLELAYLHAEALHRAGKGLEALPVLTERESASSDYRLSALIADIYVEAGQTDYGLRALERALRRAEAADLQDAQASILVKLGVLHRTLGREADAIRAFERAVQADARSWQALYNLGASYLESGQPQKALEALENALVLDSDSGELRLALATVYDQLGNTEQALSHAEAAQSRLSDPTLLADAAFITGRSLYRKGDYRGALIALEHVAAAQPDNAQAQLWSGLVQYQLGDYRTAVQYFERAVQLNPGSIEARVNLGAAYLVSQRFMDAEIVYKLLVQQNPNDAEAHYNLGWALYSQGNREEARNAWRSALDLGYTQAQEPLKEYY